VRTAGSGICRAQYTSLDLNLGPASLIAQSEKIFCKKKRKIHNLNSIFLIFNLFVSFLKPKKRSDPDGPGLIILPWIHNVFVGKRYYYPEIKELWLSTRNFPILWEIDLSL